MGVLFRSLRRAVIAGALVLASSNVAWADDSGAKAAATPDQSAPAAGSQPAAMAGGASAPASAGPASGTSAAKPAPAAAKPAAAAAPQWRRLQMRLSGSMCPACLKELEEKLRKLPGIATLKIERPQVVFSMAVSPDVSNWADGVILYDGSQLALDTLRESIKQHGYHSYRIVDKELGHDPDLKDLKFAR